MGTGLFLLLALVLPATDASGAAASTDAIPVVIGEKLVNYPIHGDTASELRSQLRTLGPFDDDQGERVAGYTRWDVSWDASTTPQPDGTCRLEQVSINLQVTMTLPEWTPGRHADSRLKVQWPSYLAALTNHEMGHRANAVRAAFAVRDAVATIAPAASCQQLGESANAAAKAAMDSLHTADADYDRQTEHGERQGALLR